MIFEKPDVLYFLFLLIIPILIHLFQLRKYRTTKFSNVALLEKIRLQSRKSSTIKKWLVLMTRLMGLAFLILAFSKPYIPNTESALKDTEVAIYMDNSFSMELPGDQVSLLEETKQNLWDQLGEQQQFSLFTNNNSWKHTNKSDIKNDFFNIDFTPVSLGFQTILLKAESMYKNQETSKSLFIITDALNFEDTPDLKTTKTIDLNFIIKEPKSLKNFYISSAKLEEKNSNSELRIEIKSSLSIDKDITVSLYDGLNLIAKARATFKDQLTSNVSFELGDTDFKKGRLELETDGMSYDNTLYFSLNQNDPIRILSLHSKEKEKNSFLSSIYKSDRFSFDVNSITNLDYSKISNADLIILNEIENFSPILKTNLEKFYRNAGTLVIIPCENASETTYSNFELSEAIYFNSNSNKRDITTISYSHPLFTSVFSEDIQNFDYPSTSKSLEINPSLSPILKYSNGSSFLAEQDRLYVFSSSLDTRFSNFINSPLVVPVFYNIALQSKSKPLLYSTIGSDETFTVKTTLGQDEILQLVSSNQQVIPKQTKLGNTIQINTQYQPEIAGHYELKQKDSTLLDLSFNYNREESDLQALDLENQNLVKFSTIQEAFNSYTEARKILELWKWMLIFALGFFLLELLILRFLN
ncbi:BatA domain-containing protein [Psychroflexus sp. MES1-P1E]|uniref:BatA domain-containing protein n=1 Tax=Psychroflexus sp. MES1-P1E TaxID=2058320 RepID=UPI000C7CFD15|nr:BatA domain-containing protein [Psychroflexus sp. MES1-P1E]PKG41743.1 aerotolerance regulator BatA [Psychroflexus sp. MES1-P1E]